MCKKALVTTLSALLIASSAFAQGGRTEAESGTVTRGVFDSPISVSGRLGVIGFQDANGSYTSRALEGITLNWNAASLLQTNQPFYLGAESGLLFSHVGPAGANFIGRNAPTETGSDANAFSVPINLVAGYKISDKLLVSALGGANMIYRSNGSQMLLGRNDGERNRVDFFPSLGLNAGWSIGKTVALTLRGDYIPTPVDDVFTGTLGATFGLG